MALVHPDQIALDAFGVADNRRFFLVDAAGRRYGQIRNGTLVRIVPEYDSRADRLTLRFPDGTVVDGQIGLGEPVETEFFSRSAAGRYVEGPWSEAISDYAGQPLRLVKSDQPGG